MKHLAVGLVLLGCYPPLGVLDPEGRVYAEPDVPAYALEGIAEWNASGLTRLSIVTGAPASTNEFTGAYVRASHGPATVRGETWLAEGRGPIIYVMVDMSPNVKRTLMHEIGHALGLEHQAQGLMKPGGSEPCIDEFTLRLAASAFQPASGALSATCR